MRILSCTLHVLMRCDWCIDLAHILAGPHVRLRLVHSLKPSELCATLVHHNADFPVDHRVHHFLHESLPVGVLEEVGQEEARVRLRRQRLVRGLRALGVNSTDKFVF